MRSHCLLSNSLWSHIFLSCSAGHAELSVKIPLIYEHVIFPVQQRCVVIFLHGYAFWWRDIPFYWRVQPPHVLMSFWHLSAFLGIQIAWKNVMINYLGWYFFVSIWNDWIANFDLFISFPQEHLSVSHNSLTTLHGELSSLPNLRVINTYTAEAFEIKPNLLWDTGNYFVSLKSVPGLNSHYRNFVNELFTGNK